MYYIIFDLEWNGAYNHASHKFFNEIIEIGAVKLDRNLNITDTFKQLVYPAFTKKLSSRCKRLTNITNDEVREYGIDFNEAFHNFARWCEGEDNVILSWSNSDLYVLSSNFIEYKGNCNVDFIHNYCDAQKYCMSYIKKEDNPEGNQVSLERCAELFGLSVDTEGLHRALTDCYVTAECFKKVFEREKIKGYIHKCDKTFFERLLFKPYYITEKVSPLFDVNDTELVCPNCGTLLDVPEDLTVQNKSFKGGVTCNYCRRSYWVFIRARKTYDDVVVKTGYVEMNKKRARRMNNQKKK